MNNGKRMYLVEDSGTRLILYDEGKETLIEIGRARGRPVPLSGIKVKLDIRESWSKLDNLRLSRFLSGGKY